MRAVLMVVANIIREEAFQVAFVNCDDVIQEITPATPYPTLCDNGVLSFAKTSHGPNLMHVTCYISTLYVAHFKRGHNFGEAQRTCCKPPRARGSDLCAQIQCTIENSLRGASL
jgi:hypothetical protein